MSPSVSSPSSDSVDYVDGTIVRQLRQALRYVQLENSRIRSRLTSMGIQELAAETRGKLPKEQSRKITDAITETQTVLQELASAAVTANIVQIPSAETTKKWRPMADRPDYQLYTHRLAMDMLKQKSEHVQQKLRDLLEATSGHSTVALVNPAPAGQAPNGKSLCARIRVPNSLVQVPVPVIKPVELAVDPSSLMRLHAVFAL